MLFNSTPFATDLSRHIQKKQCSFHALPLSGGGSLRNSEFKHRYEKLFDNIFEADLSVASPFLDCLISPSGELAMAERLAAAAYKSDATLFSTCGTTISNGIAIKALLDLAGQRVLVDRGMHQSVHFQLKDLGVEVEYIPTQVLGDDHGNECLDLNAFIHLLKKSEADEKPFDVLIINGQSYGGLICHVGYIAETILEAESSLRNILVDEAWGAANAFHPSLSISSAMIAANSENCVSNGFNIISTQSAHKSISAFRQASLIHVKGESKLIDYLREARYRYHTTSSSNIILASLDLACAQMAVEGRELLENSIRLAAIFKNTLRLEKPLRAFVVKNNSQEVSDLPHMDIDPMKVLVRCDIKGINGKKLREILYETYGIYTSLAKSNMLLFNFHIGIRQDDLQYLLSALFDICKMHAEASSQQTEELNDSFIIPYPPGVPLAVPGDYLDSVVVGKLQAACADGASLMTVSSK